MVFKAKEIFSILLFSIALNAVEMNWTPTWPYFNLIISRGEIINLPPEREIVCNFKDNNYNPSGYFYHCDVKNVNSFYSTQTTITKVWNSNDNDKLSNEDNVKAFRIQHSRYLTRIPRDIDKFFPNLELVSFYNNKELNVITREDFKQFPKLKHLRMAYNAIERIEDGTFEFTPQLEVITLNGNKIKYIEPLAFDELKNLRYLDLSHNFWNKDQANLAVNEAQVAKLISRIKNFEWMNDQEKHEYRLRETTTTTTTTVQPAKYESQMPLVVTLLVAHSLSIIIFIAIIVIGVQIVIHLIANRKMTKQAESSKQTFMR